MNAIPSTDPQLANMKLPPHSVEAEQSVLGGLLLENSAWDKIAGVSDGIVRAVPVHSVQEFRR